MSLFYRRSLQKMLDHCSYFLSNEQLEYLVGKLNLENEESLYAQWELAVLHALSASGLIEHETDFGTKPDVRWIARDLSCEFIADVRTVSDEGYEEENPREFYRRELARQVRAIGGVDPSFFRDEPHYEMEGEKYRDRKVKLRYPPTHKYKKLFNDEFRAFVQRVKGTRPDHDQVRLSGEDFDVSIIYQVQKGDFRIGGGNISYTVPYSLKRNPVFRALKKKRNQLKAAKYEGVKGIILTDGGCRMLTSRFGSSGGQTYTDQEIILAFLRGTKSISFVMTIYAERKQSLHSHTEPLQIRGKLFGNPKAHFPLPRPCEKALMEMPSYMPGPKLSADNAARHLKNGWDSHEKGWYGGARMTTSPSKTTISISSRSLAELLAQRITPERFSEINHISSSNGNLVNQWMTRGLGISAASFERSENSENKDDDHIVLTYEPDFSLKKFEVPRQGIRRLIYKLWQKSGYFPKRLKR